MKRFLLIDDDDIICIVHPAIIQQTFPGSSVEIIQSSAEAEEYLNEISTTGEPFPDAVFLDINLPQMNGFDLLNKLSDSAKEWLKQTRVYMLSSSIDDRDMERVNEIPLIHSFVGKPLTVEFLKENFD
jgi:DNA-binding NarL/FixJ family response regulator